MNSLHLRFASVFAVAALAAPTLLSPAFLVSARAQSLAANSSSNAARPAPARIAPINVLIVAVDPERASLSVRGTSPKSPNAITPALPGEDAAPPPITPASALATTPGVEWQISAKKKKPDPDDDLFRLEPEPPPAAYYPKGKAPISPTPGTLSGNAANNAANGAMQPGMRTGDVLPPALPLLSTPPLGAGATVGGSDSLAQLAISPLRRALAGAGYADALDTALDSSSVLRAVNARRLSPRVAVQLRRSVAQISTTLNATPALMAAPDASATNTQAAAQMNPPAAPLTAPVNGATPNTNTPNGAAMNMAANAAPIANATLQEAARAAARLGQALGFRAVVVVAASVAPRADGALANAPESVNYTLLLTDALRETAEPIAYDGVGRDANALAIAGATGASLIAKRLGTWPTISAAQKMQASLGYLSQARERATARDFQNAQDLLNQALALDPTNSDANKLLGDVLKPSDPAGAAQAYRRSLETNISDGETWGKVAISQTLGDRPDWPRAVEAGERALRLGYDSAELRLALVNAQLARADLYRNAEPPRYEKADTVEASAQEHLSRAFALEPANPDAVRLMARAMVSSRRYAQAVQVLDRLAPQYPDDADVQTQYALALMGLGGREEDGFKAWARAWKLSGAGENSPVDALTYGRLADGFDRRLDSIGQAAARFSLAASSGSLTREQSLSGLTKLQEEMNDASDAIKSLDPSSDSAFGSAQESRALSADLLNQSLKLHRVFLQTGQVAYQTRAMEAHRQAIANLRLVRGM